MLLSQPLGSRAAHAAEQVAQVSSTASGLRRRAAQSLVWEDLTTGAPVYEADSLFVPPGSEARVTFTNGSVLEIDDNSLVVVESAGRRERLTIALRKGSLVGSASQGPLDIRSGEAVTTLDGRSAARVANEEARSEIEVLEGAARLQTPSHAAELGRNELAAVGQAGEVRKSTPPRVALESPRRHERIRFRARLPTVALRWSGELPSGARVQIARDRGFGFIAVGAPARGHGYAFDRAAPGVFWWRLVDAAGAPLSEARRFSLLEDVPPKPIGPKPDEVVWSTPIRPALFVWSEVKGVSRYQLELARDPSFARLAHTEHAERPQVWVSHPLPEGVYYWRVRADDSERTDAPYSKARAFRLIHKPLPAAPELMRPELEVSP